jgi:hypothetical protein
MKVARSRDPNGYINLETRRLHVCPRVVKTALVAKSAAIKGGCRDTSVIILATDVLRERDTIFEISYVSQGALAAFTLRSKDFAASAFKTRFCCRACNGFAKSADEGGGNIFQHRVFTIKSGNFCICNT